MLDNMHSIHVHIMRLQRRYYRMFGKNISAFTMNRHVAKLKKRTKPHWDALPSQVVQDVVLRRVKPTMRSSEISKRDKWVKRQKKSVDRTLNHNTNTTL